MTALDGGAERILARRTAPESVDDPSWRPDGKAIVFRALDRGHEVTLSYPDGSLQNLGFETSHSLFRLTAATAAPVIVATASARIDTVYTLAV